MNKPKVEVVKTKTEDGKDLTLHIKYPSSRNYEDAKVLYSVQWNKFVKVDNVQTKKQLDETLEEKGIWSKKDEEKKRVLGEEIVELGKKLKAGKMKKAEGRALAIKMHEKRNEYAEHIAVRSIYDMYTAEGMAENIRFNYLLSACVVDTDKGEPYFKDLDDYTNRQDEKAAWDVARKFGTMIYGGDFSENAEENVLEIQFLRKFGFIDTEGNYIDPKTKARVDVKGDPLPKDKVDTDIYGNPIKDGKVEVEFGEFLDDEEPPITSPAKESPKVTV